ncbi:MAG: hypothetical protein ACKO34_04100, partial [Vampirovibrionales bacterium]
MSMLRFTQLPIKYKLPALFVSMVVASCVITSVTLLWQATESFKAQSESKQTTLLDAKKQRLNDYLNSILSDLKVLVDDETVRQALYALDAGYQQLASKGNATQYLQSQYIDKNPNPLGSKHQLMKAPDGSNYSQAHAKFHPFLKNLVDQRGYYDVFLVNPKGEVVYTVFKERDYATNLRQGQWKDTDLADVFKRALAHGSDSSDAGDFAFSDFRAYAPSNNVPAAFIAHPLHSDASHTKTIGTLIFQMPVGKMNAVMQSIRARWRTSPRIFIRFSKGPWCF